MKIEHVLEVFTTSQSPRHFNELVAHFEIFQTEHSELAHHLEVLLQYQLIQELKPHTYQATKQDLIGTITINTRGFGFVIPQACPGTERKVVKGCQNILCNCYRVSFSCIVSS